MDLTLLVRFSVWRIGTSSEETPPAAAIAFTVFRYLRDSEAEAESGAARFRLGRPDSPRGCVDDILHIHPPTIMFLVTEKTEKLLVVDSYWLLGSKF